MDTTPMHIQPTGVIAEPAPFPSEMADISSIGLTEGYIPPDLLYATDYRDTPYSMKPQNMQEQTWGYAQIGGEIQNPSGDAGHYSWPECSVSATTGSRHTAKYGTTTHVTGVLCGEPTFKRSYCAAG